MLRISGCSQLSWLTVWDNKQKACWRIYSINKKRAINMNQIWVRKRRDSPVSNVWVWRAPDGMMRLGRRSSQEVIAGLSFDQLPSSSWLTFIILYHSKPYILWLQNTLYTKCLVQVQWNVNIINQFYQPGYQVMEDYIYITFLSNRWHLPFFPPKKYCHSMVETILL